MQAINLKYIVKTVSGLRRFAPAGFLVAAGALLALDRALKFIAYKNDAGQSLPLLPGVSFSLYKNTAMVFGLPFPQAIVTPLSVAVFLVIVVEVFRRGSRALPRHTASALFLAGALSNIADRVFYGGTLDYILIADRSAWNVADIMIILGLFLLLSSRRGRHRPLDKK